MKVVVGTALLCGLPQMKQNFLGSVFRVQRSDARHYQCYSYLDGNHDGYCSRSSNSSAVHPPSNAVAGPSDTRWFPMIHLIALEVVIVRGRV